MQQEQNLSSSILLGDLIAKYPSGGPFVLNKLGIDYCCGGQRSLISATQSSEEACLSIIKQVQEKEMELKQQQQQDTSLLQQGMVDWKASQLVQHIIRNHHDYLRENIPVLSQLLLKIYTVHMGKLIQQARQSPSSDESTDVASSHPSILLMEKMYKTFQSLATELLVHLAKEEKDVFPLIIQYDEEDKSNSFLKSKLKSLMEEHDEAGVLIKLLASMKMELPDYCKTVENTKRLLTELEENLYLHVHLENNILFKRVLSSLNDH